MSLERRITMLETGAPRRAVGDAAWPSPTWTRPDHRAEVLAGGRTMSLDAYYRRYPDAETLPVPGER